jgi:hypothetical protein
MRDEELHGAMQKHREHLYSWLETRDPASVEQFMEALIRIKREGSEFHEVVIDGATAQVMASMCLIEMTNYLDHLNIALKGGAD